MTLQWAWCLLLLATIDRGLATIDIEAEAIKEAAMKVDDYYQFRDTAGRQMTSKSMRVILAGQQLQLASSTSK